MDFRPTLYTITQAAKLLGVPEHKIHYGHRSGKLDDATWRFAGRRAYSTSDMKRLAEFFNVDVPESVIEAEQDDRDRHFRRYMMEKHGWGSIENMRALDAEMKQHGIKPPCSIEAFESFVAKLATAENNCSQK